MAWYDLDEVLSKAELPEVARQLGMNVERQGASLVTMCPFHEDTRPSLILYSRTASSPSHFHCFSCNEHGYAVDLIKQVHGVEFKPAIEWLAHSLGISPKRTATTPLQIAHSTRETALAFALRVFDQQHDEADFAEWCQSRQFDRDFLYNFGLRCLPIGSILVQALQVESFGRRQELIDGLLSLGLLARMRPKPKANAQASLNLHEQFRDYFQDGRILIPIRTERNDVSAFAGRYRAARASSNIESTNHAKYLLTPGFHKAQVLFNANRAKQTLRNMVQAGEPHPVLYVVEGFLDAIRLQSLNLAAVAVMGTSVSDEQRVGLVKLIDAAALPGHSYLSLRLFFDRDAAGFDGAHRALRQLLGLPGIAAEWIGFEDRDQALSGKDPDEILKSLSIDEAKAALDRNVLPAVGILVAASLGYKDATPLIGSVRWNDVSRYARERALLQTVRTLRALSSATVDWTQRLEALVDPRPQWVVDLLKILVPQKENGHLVRWSSAFELNFLIKHEARLNHARTLAEHGARRGELPCDEETWRALDRNAQLFNALALDRLKQPVWQQVAACDAVHLPRKLSSDQKMLKDPRRKVMPHAADLHLQQFLMNELLSERRDFSHEGPRSFSDCIPAVRWFATEGETRVTGYVREGEMSPALRADEIGTHDEPVLSFAYQIDMEVLEGRRNPTDQGMFRPYIECWREYMASLGRQAHAIGPHVHVLRLDAKRYYDTIQLYVIRDQLLESIEQALTITGSEDLFGLLGLATNNAQDAARRLVDLLCSSLFKHRYVHPDDGSERLSSDAIGIPQGPVISAWIGTIAMFSVDAAARAFMRQPEQRHAEDPTRPLAGYARYVDDIVLFADSKNRLNALRETVQIAAARLDLTLVRKGDSVAPGSPESVMRQLNNGRAMAPSVPVWEPPMTGDGETGWGIGTDDVGPMDRQSALHLLRHPSLLDDPNTTHEKVRDAMRAPDLRPSDLGKCARALWWQVAIQSIKNLTSSDEVAWEILWNAYHQRWSEVCIGHEWAPAFARQGNDILFAVEGLDMLMDSGLSMEKGRTQDWIYQHRKALNTLAGALLRTKDILQHAPPAHNNAHILSRIKKVQWKAMQRRPDDATSLYSESQKSHQRTLTDWLCQAAILLHRYGTSSETKAHPLETLPKLSDSPYCLGPEDIQAACRYLKIDIKNETASVDSYVNALKIALPFLVANTTDKCRWAVLSLYPDTLAKNLPNAPTLKILPPLPVEGAGMLAYTSKDGTPGIQLIAFRHQSNDSPPDLAVGAELSDIGADSVESIQLRWLAPEELAPGLYRRQGEQPVGVEFEKFQPSNRARFAADLYDILYAIQQQNIDDGKEWVTVIAHLAHDHIPDGVCDVKTCKWYLISEPVASSHMGVSAWIRDGRGGLRSISVPGGEYTKLWRLGCAVSDALDLAFDLPSEGATIEDEDDALAHPHQIENYVLRQQLGKLRGVWIAEAQVQVQVTEGLPGTIRRSLEILRRFDPNEDSATQVRLVLHTEAETRSMAMRLQRKGPSDLRDRLHLLPALVLRRLPLSVLEWLPLQCSHVSTTMRSDLALLWTLANTLNTDNLKEGSHGSSKPVSLGPAQALHIGLALAATGAALRGLVASAWGIARRRLPIAYPEYLPIPTEWDLPDTSQQDPQGDYDVMRKGISNDDWSALKDATPWQWMLALLGILEGMAPQLLHAPGENPLRKVYEHLRQWQLSPPEDINARQWTWPYDDMPTYDATTWNSLLQLLPSATLQLDQHLGLTVRQIEAPVFRRHRDDAGFTDAESQQWVLTKLQYTGLGSSDSVARVQRGSRRLAKWSEVRRDIDNELLSIHTLDDKLGRWWAGHYDDLSTSIDEPIGTTNEVPILENNLPVISEDRTKEDLKNHIDDVHVPSGDTTSYGDVLESQRASWRDRGKLKSPSHMRVALFQWNIDESYSHPLAEVGLMGMGLPDRALTDIRKVLIAKSAMSEADKATIRGKEYTWSDPDPESVPSWPEHRRRSLLKRALEACKQLDVDLLVLPEVSVRRDTVIWLEDQLYRHYAGLAVLAGTYRHFGRPLDDLNGTAAAGRTVHPLMAPLSLLWCPHEELSKVLFPDLNYPPRTLRFWRGKKYRAVAANELFYPDWNSLEPLFRLEPLLDQLGGLDMSLPHQRALLMAVSQQMPPLRYCMELICSELFLLTSPANAEPLRQEIASMLRRFPGSASADAVEIVGKDLQVIGEALSVLQKHSTPRRTVLLVPAATKRSNDYWHAGQASVLASGTATVFCNAAKSAISCGGSCFIGIDSATKPHSELAGLVETLTPYHGWRKGILTARADGSLSEADQALVVADIDPVHVVTGRPRPQLLPEPMALVAYLPVVELLDKTANKAAVYRTLSEELPVQIQSATNVNEVLAALGKIATSSRCSKTVEPTMLWSAFQKLRQAHKFDGPELDEFVKMFHDPKAMRERLLTWERDRHQQPHPAYGPLNLEPAWLDFLAVDLTLKVGQPLPRIAVPPWTTEASK